MLFCGLSEVAYASGPAPGGYHFTGIYWPGKSFTVAQTEATRFWSISAKILFEDDYTSVIQSQVSPFE